MVLFSGAVSSSVLFSAAHAFLGGSTDSVTNYHLRQMSSSTSQHSALAKQS